MIRLYYKLKDIPFNIKMFFQKLFRGWSDREIWNLDDTIVKFVVPRLKVLREETIGYPFSDECKTFEDWEKMLDEMIFGLEFLNQRDEWYEKNVMFKSGKDKEKALEEFKSMLDRAEKGRILFGKYLPNLWW